MSISRREFLRSSGALVVSCGAIGVGPLASAQGPFATHASHIDPSKVDSWIAVAADGSVTAYSGKVELGQGMFTAQTQLVAEELCVAIEKVRLVLGDTAVCPDQGTTSGSQSTPTNFNDESLAQAAATAREALVIMAAERLGESADGLTSVHGVVVGKRGRVSYAELIGSKKFDLPVNTSAKRRTAAQWNVLGQPIPALDRPALMTGRFEFVHNVRVPGMLHGRVIRPATVGATFSSVDRDSVSQMPGFVKLVVRENFVGVVAEKQWQAIQAARQLKVNWNLGSVLPPQKTFFESLRKQASRETMVVNSKDTEERLAGAFAVVEATYAYPYQMHGSIGSSCAVADVKRDRATVWSATQSPYPTRDVVAKLVGLAPDNVRVVYVRGSGCYGLNGADAVSFDAAVMSQVVGRPVRVQLSRQDEMAWENFGAACVVEQRAGIDQNGKIVAWECNTWNTAKGNRPGYNRPGNVITGELLGFPPEQVAPGPAREPKGPLHNGSNFVPSYFAGCAAGKCAGSGTIRSEKVLAHTVASPFFTGPLRSPLRIQNTFAHECFIDELCVRAQEDPVSFRLQYLSDERVIGVLKAAADAAKGEKRLVHKIRSGGEQIVSGRGVACVAYEGDNGYAALIADVHVDLATGRVEPYRFVMAIDAGPISNPDGLRNQTEGGLLQGMSRTLTEEVTWDHERVTSNDWKTYRSLYMDFKLPRIDLVLVNRDNVPATGAGETAITVVPGAIGNAIFDATGVRLREVPFTAERVKAALRAAAIGEGK